MHDDDSASTDLASVLTRWIRRERLRPQQIQRASGITRAHLWLMTTGQVLRPTPDTLRALARALATDPDTGELDRVKRDLALSELSRAAGYPQTTSEEATASEAEHVIQALVGNQQEAEFWLDIIVTNRGLSPTYQQMIRAYLALLARPGGSDVVSLLMPWFDPDRTTSAELAAALAKLRRTTGV